MSAEAPASITLETRLSREQFFKVAMSRYLQRPIFYFYALACAGLLAYGFLRGPLSLMIVGLVPFLIYLLMGMGMTLHASRGKDNPILAKTRYTFTPEQLVITSKAGESVVGWEHFSAWTQMAECYVLAFKAGPVLAIPQSQVPPHQVAQFEALLRRCITDDTQPA